MQFKEEMIDTLETCSKFYFQIGQYEEVRRGVSGGLWSSAVLHPQRFLELSHFFFPCMCPARLPPFFTTFVC